MRSGSFQIIVPTKWAKFFLILVQYDLNLLNLLLIIYG